jgi:hypothetical protein
MDGALQVGDVLQNLVDQEAVIGLHTPVQCQAQRGIFARKRPLANSASVSGVPSSRTIASTIWRPLRP